MYSKRVGELISCIGKRQRIKASIFRHKASSLDDYGTLAISATTARDQCCMVLILDEDGFDRVIIRDVDPEAINILRADKQVQIWDSSCDDDLLLAIIEDVDNNGITSIESLVICDDADNVIKTIDMTDPSDFKSGMQFCPDAYMNEYGLKTLAGSVTVYEHDLFDQGIFSDKILTIH